MTAANRDHCEACPAPDGLPCHATAGECRRAARPGEDAFRAILARHATVRAEQAEAPGLAARALGYIGALARHAALGSPEVDAETAAARLATCQTCPYFTPDGAICRAPGCGCRMEIKATWADASCPLDPPRWGPATPAPDPSPPT